MNKLDLLYIKESFNLEKLELETALALNEDGTDFARKAKEFIMQIIKQLREFFNKIITYIRTKLNFNDKYTKLLALIGSKIDDFAVKHYPEVHAEFEQIIRDYIVELALVMKELKKMEGYASYRVTSLKADAFINLGPFRRTVAPVIQKTADRYDARVERINQKIEEIHNKYMNMIDVKANSGIRMMVTETASNLLKYRKDRIRKLEFDLSAYMKLSDDFLKVPSLYDDTVDAFVAIKTNIASKVSRLVQYASQARTNMFQKNEEELNNAINAQMKR